MPPAAYRAERRTETPLARSIDLHLPAVSLARFGYAVACLPMVTFLLIGIGGDRDLRWLPYVLAIGIGIAAPPLGFLSVVPLLPLNHPGVWGPLGPLVIVLAVLGVAAIAHIARSGRRLATADLRVVVLGLAFIAVSAAQLIPSRSVLGGIPPFALGNLGQVVSSVLVLVVGVLVVRGRSVWPYIVAYGVSAAFVSMIAIFHLARPSVLRRLDLRWLVSPDATRFRATGIVGNPNYLAAFLAVAFVLLVGIGILWLLRNRTWTALGAISLAAPVTTAVLLTLSRAAVLAALAGAIVAVARQGFRWAVGVAVVGTLAVVLAYPAFLHLRLDRTFPSDPGSQDAAQGESDRLRFVMVGAALEAFLDAPLIGHGFSTFQAISPGYSGQDSLRGAHNALLTVAAEQGIVGVSLLLGLVAAAVVPVWRAGRGLPAVCLGSFAAFAAFTMTGDLLASVQVGGGAWLLLALGSQAGQPVGSRLSLPWHLTLTVRRGEAAGSARAASASMGVPALGTTLQVGHPARPAPTDD